jgi:hypothetical protein
MSKVKITFVVQEQLQKELRQQIINDGYSMQEKSKWIAEAIQNFLKIENYIELVNLGDVMQGFEKSESVVIEPTLKKMLDEAVLVTRKSYPLLEGVQSRIIRTSIVQRLIRS